MTKKELEHKIKILELKNKALEAQIEVLKSEVQYYVYREAGIDI